MALQQGNNEKTLNSTLANSQKNMDLARKLEAQGKKKEAQELLAKNSKGLAQESTRVNQNMKSTNQAVDKGIEDTLKGAVGTASWFVPGGQGKVMPWVSAGATGGMFGYGASEKGKELPSIVGGVAGSILAKGTVDVLSAVGKKLFKSVPERIMNSLFKEPLKKSGIGEKSLGSQALGKGEVGTDAGIYKRALDKVGELEEALQKKLFGTNQTVDISKVKETVGPQLSKLRQSGNTQAADYIEKRLASIEQVSGGMIPAARANEIKRAIYDELRGAYGSESVANKETLKAVARAFKEQIGEVPGVNQINKDLGYYGRVADVLEKKILREQGKAGIGLIDSIIGVGGMASGAGGPAVALIAGKHALGSTLGKTAIAQGLNKAGQVLGGVANSPVGSAISSGVNTLGRVGGTMIGNSMTLPSPSITPTNQAVNQESPTQNPEHNNYATSPQTTSQVPDYISGHSPQELYQAYQTAITSGDEASAEVIRQMYEDEVAHQKAGGTGVKKNAKQQSFANAAAAGQEALDLLTGGNVATGLGQDVIGGIGEKTGWNSQTQTEYRSAIGLARTLARNSLLGANMTPRELESLSAAIPEFNDAPEIARVKLTQFVKLMNQFSLNFAGVPEEAVLPSPSAQ